jgi:HPt (histidine-containing phosphotransfer) domain-containing protein
VTKSPPIDLIDIAQLASATSGDQALQREILRLFDQQASITLVHLASEEAAVIAGLAHKLVGSARAIGAFKLAATAEAVERAVSDAGEGEVAVMVKNLSSALREVQVAIAQLDMARAETNAPNPLDPAP